MPCIALPLTVPPIHQQKNITGGLRTEQPDLNVFTPNVLNLALKEIKPESIH